MSRKHARLSPSSANIWLNCSASVQPTNSNASKKTTKSAVEGTLAHNVGEAILNGEKDKLKQYMQNPNYSVDMIENVKPYTDYCLHRYKKLKEKYDEVGLKTERKIILEKYVPEGYGMADCLIYTRDYLEVVDLKYGLGVIVDIKNNPQLKLYALGALEKLTNIGCKIKTVRITVCQVRVDKKPKSIIIPVDELRDWGNLEVKPKAIEAYKEGGEFNAGEWCQFCRYKPICGYRANLIIKQAVEKLNVSVGIMNNLDIASLLEAKELLMPLFNSIENVARNKMMKGEEIEGYTLGKTSRRRDFVNEDLMAKDFEKAGYTDIYKLKTIKDLEKMMGKETFEKISAPYTKWKETKPSVKRRV